MQLSQPHLIDQIIKDDQISSKTTAVKPLPFFLCILQRYRRSPSYKGHSYYQLIIDKLKFLEKGSRPETAYIVHQLARFSEDPKEGHDKVLLHLSSHLYNTNTQSIILKTDPLCMLGVYVDVNFCGNWNIEIAMHDVIMAKIVLVSLSYLQGVQLVALLNFSPIFSTTKAEYINLSQSLCYIIPIMHLLKKSIIETLILLVLYPP